MYLPNEIINIIFSYIEKPKSFLIINELISKYNKFIDAQFLESQYLCRSPFYRYFFRIFLVIWKKWPENYPYLLEMKKNR